MGFQKLTLLVFLSDELAIGGAINTLVRTVLPMKNLEGSVTCCKETTGYADSIPSRVVPPGTILANRYGLGQPLGIDVFGPRYLGYDTHVNQRVTIKEYFPLMLAARELGSLNVIPSSGDKEPDFRHGARLLLDEGYRLQRLGGWPAVREVLTENATVYVVREFSEGIPLETYAKNHAGPLPEKFVLGILESVLNTLRGYHALESTHLAISPRTILVCETEQAGLIGSSCRARAAFIKRVGFALPLSDEGDPDIHFCAPELFGKPERLGPWTDLYALAATCYFALMGEVPGTASERSGFFGRPLLPPHRFANLSISKKTSGGLMKALELRPEKRFRDVDEMELAMLEIRKTCPEQHRSKRE